MPWRIHYGSQWTHAMLDEQDNAWVPVEWLRDTLALSKYVDDTAKAVYLTKAQEHWVDLARRMAGIAKLTEIEIKLLCATVEAESNGDNAVIEWDGVWEDEKVGGAGFGQIWPKWHGDIIVLASDLLKRPTLPIALTDNEEVHKALLLHDPEVSMLATALLIRNIWYRVDGDWDAFTEAYVGAAISDADRERRRAIWEKWQK